MIPPKVHKIAHRLQIPKDKFKKISLKKSQIYFAHQQTPNSTNLHSSKHQYTHSQTTIYPKQLVHKHVIQHNPRNPTEHTQSCEYVVRREEEREGCNGGHDIVSMSQDCSSPSRFWHVDCWAAHTQQDSGTRPCLRTRQGMADINARDQSQWAV